MDLRDYLRIIRRRWFQMITIMIVVGAFQMLLIYTKPQVYSSSVEILIKQSPYELGFIVPEEYPYPPVPLESRVTMLNSYKVCEKTSELLKTKHQYAMSPEAILGGLTVVSGKDRKDIVRLTFVNEVPGIIKKILEAHLESFVMYDIDATSKDIDAARDFLTRKQREIDRELDDSRRKLKDIIDEGVKNGVVDPKIQSDVKVQQLVELEKLRQQNSLELQRIRAQVKHIPVEEKEQIKADLLNRHMVVTPVDMSAADPSLGKLYGDLRSRLAALRRRYTDSNPQILEIKNEIEEITRLIHQENRRPAEVRILPLEERLRILDITDGFLKEILAQEWKALSNITEVAQLQSRFQKVTDKLEDLKLKRAVLDDRRKYNYEIVRPASEPAKTPRTAPGTLPFIVLISAIVGIAGGYITEYLNDTLRTSSDIKAYLNLPTIATIPKIPENEHFLLQLAVKSPTVELYNKLATFLLTRMLDLRAKTLLFTSAKAGEGKSTVSANLAIAMAQMGERVVLVDTDLRKPQYHIIFGLDNSRGLSSILSGELDAEQKLHKITNGKGKLGVESYLQPTAVDTLSVLTSGPIPMNPITQLKSDRMTQLLSELRSLADIVILDSPPVLMVVDSAILATMSDLTALIVSENNVRRTEMGTVKQTFNQVKADVVGVILNKASLQSETYYYYYQYRGYRA